MSLLNQRHYFLSALLYHQSQLFLPHPNKDRALIAKEIRLLLLKQVASQDRVILANCVLLWPHWPNENLYQIDVSNCPGLISFIEFPTRLPAALASELGFIISILGYYNAQVSKSLMQRFLTWLDTSIQLNVQFKITVMAMMISPHPPLPPPSLPSMNSDPQVCIAQLKNQVVDLGLKLLPKKLSLLLLGTFLSQYTEKTIPTIFVLLENEANQTLVWSIIARVSSFSPLLFARTLTKLLFTSSLVSSSNASSSIDPINIKNQAQVDTPFSTKTKVSSSSNLTPLKKTELLSQSVFTFSAKPFQSPSVSPSSFFPSQITLHILQWFVYLVSSKTCLATMHAAAPSISIPAVSLPYYLPPTESTLLELTRWFFSEVGPLFSYLIVHHKSTHGILREFMDAIPEKHSDWWISLQCDLTFCLTTTKLVCEWMDQLAHLIQSSSSSSLISLNVFSYLISSSSSPLWTLRMKFPNSDTVLDSIDHLFTLCLTKAKERKFHLNCAFLFDHLSSVLLGPSTTEQSLPPIHTPFLYASRLIQLIPYGEHDTEEPCISLLNCLIEKSGEHGYTSDAFSFLLHWLSSFQCTFTTTSKFVEWVTLSHWPMQLRKKLLETLTHHPQFLTSEHITALAQSILMSFAPDALKLELASVLLKVLQLYPSVSFDASVIDAILVHLTYPDAIATAFLPVAAKLPHPFTYSTSLPSFQRQVLQSPHTGWFRSTHFQWLTQRTEKEFDVTMLRGILHHTSSVKLSPLLWQSKEALIFFSAFELARYCLLTRLKTPLGSSSQTLAGLEQWLHQSKSRLAVLTISFLEKWVQAAWFQYAPNGHTTSSSSSSSSLASSLNASATSSLLSWASVPKASCIYFTANQQGMLNWFQKMKKWMAMYMKPLAMVGEVLLHEPFHDLSCVELHWEDALVHPGYQALAQGRVELARSLLPDPSLAYVMVSDYTNLEKYVQQTVPFFDPKKKGPSSGSSSIQELCWNILRHPNDPEMDPTKLLSLDPIFLCSPLTYIRSALLETRVTRIETHLTSAISKVWVPYRFLDQFPEFSIHDSTSTSSSSSSSPALLQPLTLVRLQRKLKNFAIARTLIRVYPELPKMERVKIDLAEGVLVGFDILKHFPTLLSKQMMLNNHVSSSSLISSLAPSSPSSSCSSVFPTSLILNTFLSNLPDTFIHSWFPPPLLVPAACAPLLNVLHSNPNDVKAWRLLAKYFADLVLQPEDPSVHAMIVEKALNAMIQYLKVETKVYSKTNSMALHLLSLVSSFPSTSLISASSTPSECWVKWVPQLVALFRSSPPTIAQWASDILTQLAQTHPHACIYPILVAFQDEHPALLDAFQSESLVASTRVFIQHALKATVLWEEIWFHELLQLQSQVYKRQCSLDFMISHVTSLTQTCLTFPITFHEQWFRDVFETEIFKALHSLESFQTRSRSSSTSSLSLTTPELNVKRLWQPFRDLLHKLNPIVNKSRTLQVEDLGLFLDLDLSDVYLPGTSEKFQSVLPNVLVLPTKTKPKKMMFTSHTGQSHTYLIKGRENLHLDQLMMQFMHLVNDFLPSHSTKAHAYAVVPLGSTAGMIQWIDAVSIYTLYKRHHLQRYHQPPPKPAQAFNTHAQKLLHLKSNLSLPLPTSSSFMTHALRDPCSLDQLILIYHALCAENTDQLLKQELLFQSVTSFDYLSKTRAFTHSVALTSVLGFFMGLGDRHLDNILFSLPSSTPTTLDSLMHPSSTFTPHLVHIDYAICFDRGADPHFLKVPEKVPFRLTRNFIAAMNVFYPTCFRYTMLNTMQCIQQHGQDVLRLMESFFHPFWDSSSSSSTSSSSSMVSSNPAGYPSSQSETSLLPLLELHTHVGQEAIDDGGEAEASGDRLSGDPQKRAEGKVIDLPSTQILKSLKQKLQCQMNGVTLPLNQFVDKLIEQATNETNLASMYEGWLPWL